MSERAFEELADERNRRFLAGDRLDRQIMIAPEAFDLVAPVTVSPELDVEGKSDGNVSIWHLYSSAVQCKRLLACRGRSLQSGFAARCNLSGRGHHLEMQPLHLRRRSTSPARLSLVVGQRLLLARFKSVAIQTSASHRAIASPPAALRCIGATMIALRNPPQFRIARASHDDFHDYCVAAAPIHHANGVRPRLFPLR